MSRKLWGLVPVLVLLAATAGADGTVYKWIDKEGRTHYTDCPPPPGCQAEVIETLPPPNKAEVEQARQRLDALLAEQEKTAAAREQERLERQRQQVAAMQIAAARKRACIEAQQNLHALLMNRPVYYINEKGERVFLDETAHKAEIEHTRQLIRENCGTD
jgi:hypothetical protein